MSLQDFDELAALQCVQVEHQTIPGFLRRIPHKWHLNEITRFGSEVGRAADAMQLVFMTPVDGSLGVLRRLSCSRSSSASTPSWSRNSAGHA